MMFKRFHWLSWLFLAAGLVTALLTLATRHRVEGRSRAVALVLDYPQLSALAAASGVPMAEALRQFKASGITGVAVSEESLAELQANGALELVPGGASGGRETRVRIADRAVAERVADYVGRYVRGATETAPAQERMVFAGPGGGAIYVPGRFEDIRTTPVGLSEAEAREVREAGLDVVARINNPLGLTPESLRWSLSRIRELGVETVIFAGDEVLGYRGLVDQTADLFRELGLSYGSVEFGKQRGDDRLSAKLLDRMVRVHSISSAEMPRLTPGEAIERYVRAAAERNIRLNYVRLPGVVTQQTFGDSLAYVHSLAHETAGSGFGLAAPRPFTRVWSPNVAGRVPLALIGAGVAAGTVMLLAGLVPLPLGSQALLTMLGAAAAGAIALSGIMLGLQLLALAAAIVFPTLAFVLFPQPVGAFDDHQHATVRERSQAMVPAVAEFIAISVVTLTGAAMVAGLLSELPFFMKVKAFLGIKASTVLPLLLVGWIYLTGMSGLYPDWRTERAAVTERLQRFFSEPLRVWQVLACGIGLVALALLVARSGNDPGVGVSELELRFRSLLDRVMGVRPRTKEFLIGHPVLLLALGMAAVPRWRQWALPVMLVGAIGQTGMLNSFCHLHTPIKLTVLRTFNGLWTGVLIGVVLLWLWIRFQGGRRAAETSLTV